MNLNLNSSSNQLQIMHSNYQIQGRFGGLLFSSLQLSFFKFLFKKNMSTTITTKSTTTKDGVHSDAYVIEQVHKEEDKSRVEAHKVNDKLAPITTRY